MQKLLAFVDRSGICARGCGAWSIRMIGLFTELCNWRERRAILHDVSRRKRDHDEITKFQAQDQLVYAEAAIERDDLREAAEIWDRLMATHRRDAEESPKMLHILLRLKRFDEAERIMLAGQNRHPGDQRFAIGLLEIAIARGDWDLAISRSGFARKRFPGSLRGFLFGSEAYRAKGEPEKADVLMGQAIKQFPDDALGFLEFARVAVARSDWVEAEQRWRLFQTKFPNKPFGHIGCAQALIQQRRFDEADAVLAAVRTQFGTEWVISAEMARCSEARGDRDEAIRRWKLLVQRFPLNRFAYFEAGAGLHRLGDTEGGEQFYRDAVARFDEDRRAWIELADFLCNQRRDRLAAAEVWRAYREAFPDREEGYVRGAQALKEAGQSEQADAILLEWAGYSR